jgi:hypothetical protein
VGCIPASRNIFSKEFLVDYNYEEVPEDAVEDDKHNKKPNLRPPPKKKEKYPRHPMSRIFRLRKRGIRILE